MVSTLHSVVAPYESRVYASDIWKCYSNGRVPKLSGRVNSISVCNENPHKYAIPNGHKMYLYRSDSDRLYRKISGFGTRITCGEFRSDGKLIIVGEEGGVLRICTTDKNTYHLRKIPAHKGLVSDVKFLLDDYRAVSIGIDSNVRIWDVALGTSILDFVVNSGKEPTKGLAVGRQNNNLLICGDLRGGIPIFDIRERKPVSTVQISRGVSALALNKSDDKLVIAAGSSIYVWDMTAGQFTAQTPSTSDYSTSYDSSLRLHYKLVTSLAVLSHPEEGEGEVLLSVSLDKLAKFTHLSKWKELHEIQCPLPLTAAGATNNCETVVLGGEKGFIKIQHLDRKLLTGWSSNDSAQNKKLPLTEADAETLGGVDASFLRLAGELSGRWRGGDQYIAMTTDEWLSQPFDTSRRGPMDWLSDANKGMKSTTHLPVIHPTSEISLAIDSLSHHHSPVGLLRADHLLRRFSHTAALSAATRSQIRLRGGKFLPEGSRLRLAVAVVGELLRRGTLRAAVAGRDVRQLTRLLRFVRRNVWRLETAATCLQLFNCLLDVYTPNELVLIPEFSKVNRILQCLSSNYYALNYCAKFVKSGFSNLARGRTKLASVKSDTANCIETSQPPPVMSGVDSSDQPQRLQRKRELSPPVSPKSRQNTPKRKAVSTDERKPVHRVPTKE